MFIKQYGEGKQTYYCLHGWGGDHREFAPLALHLPREARLLCPDLPGYGQSPALVQWSAEELVREVDTSVGSLCGEPCTLVGFCSGAVLSVVVAVSKPHRFRRVVLIDPFAYMPWYFRLFLAGNFGRKAYRTTFMTPTGRSITNCVLRRIQASQADFTQAFESIDPEVALKYLEILARLDLRRQFARFPLPVSIAYGRRTFRAVRRSVAMFGALWPQAQVYCLEKAGHFPIVEGRQELGDIIFETRRGEKP